MDNMLQVEILHVDTRGLFVPTAIQKLTINVKAHNNIINSMPEPEEGKPRECAIPSHEVPHIDQYHLTSSCLQLNWKSMVSPR